MQKVRFRRYAQVFKVCLELGLMHVDMFNVFYEASVNLFVSPQIRCELIEHCYRDLLKTPSSIATSIKEGSSEQRARSAMLCYLVILEANDDPCAVQHRFDKRIIDIVFDTTHKYLNSVGDRDVSMGADGNSTLLKRIWCRIAYHQARYLIPIKQHESA